MSKNYLFSKMYDSPHDTNAIVWHYSVMKSQRDENGLRLRACSDIFVWN